MSRSVAIVLAFYALLLPAVASAAPSAQAGCQFVLGFAQVRGLVGAEKVGGCLENEHHNPDNGDALQQTSGGLLVWRKADNFTAFTDGYQTWVNGPRGLQRRLNTEKFDWEGGGQAAPAAPGAASADAACGRASATLTIDRREGGPDGTVEVGGAVTNQCREAVDVFVEIVARAQAGGASSQPIVDAPTVVVPNVPPGATRPFTARLPSVPGVGGFSGDAFPVPTRFARGICVDVGASKCLNVDRRLWSAIVALLPFDQTRPLVQAAAEAEVPIMVAALPEGTSGGFAPGRRLVVVAEALNASSAWARASVLAHELQHVADWRAGLLPTASEKDCYQAEVAAFRRSAAFWQWLWGNRLPAGFDEIHAIRNDLTRASSSDPTALARYVERTYKGHCGQP